MDCISIEKEIAVAGYISKNMIDNSENTTINSQKVVEYIKTFWDFGPVIMDFNKTDLDNFFSNRSDIFSPVGFSYGVNIHGKDDVEKKKNILIALKAQMRYPRGFYEMLGLGFLFVESSD